MERLVKACQESDPGMIPVALSREEKALKKVADAVCGGGSGNSELLNSILYRTATELNLEGVTALGKYALSSFENLVSVSLPDCETIGVDSLGYNTNLKYLNAPKVKTVNAFALRNCSALTEFNFPNVETIANQAFMGCTGITRAILPKWSGEAKTDNIGACTNMVYANLPMINVLGGSVFNNFDNLKTVDLTAVTKINNSAFANCANLSALIIRNTEVVCTLGGAYVFNNSGIANGTGYVYVPDDMVESYKTAEIWSTYADQIKPLSELDETSEEK